MNKVLAGENAEAAVEQFEQDTEEFGSVLEGQIRGGDKVKKISNRKVIAMLFSSVSDYVGEVLDNAEELLSLQEAARNVAAQSDALFAASAAFEQAVTEFAAERPIKEMQAYVFGAIALVCLILLGWNMKREAEKRAEAEREANERNQKAILRLLDEMSNLADGDLTSYATVTEDFTGAIADSINYTIDALRDVVTTINTTSEHPRPSRPRPRP